MGWFSESTEGIPFKVWKTRAEQLKGMSTEAMKAVTSGNDAVIVTFFEGRQLECKVFFERTGIPFLELTNGFPASKNPSIYLMSAGDIHLTSFTSLRNSILLFHGMHPFPGREDQVAQKFPNAVMKWCCASLEDPLFKAFGMESVATLMESLGMKDNECIEHKFVDKAIVSAQQKLKAKVRNELAAATEEEWFQKNVNR
jgi:hypothetical protein